MDKIQAEENIKVIREIMERSARYTNFSGLSGIIAGVLALLGVWINVRLASGHLWGTEINTSVFIWTVVFVLALGQDAYFANRKARKSGQTIWNPTTYQIIRAVLPGILLAVVLSLRALTLHDLNSIPPLWSLGYGVAISSAGMFSVKEVRVFGVVQFVTGALGLFFASMIPTSLYLILSFGIYHILFGLWMSRKYGW